MNRSVTFRTVVATALGLAALAATTASHARGDFQITIGVPGQVYVQPAPVYVQPRPVYAQPQVVYQSRGGAWGDRDHDGVPNAYDRWDNRRHTQYTQHALRPWGDADRDGVANRYDRAPTNPYRY